MAVTPGPWLYEFTHASRLNQDLIARRVWSGAICESMTLIRQALRGRWRLSERQSPLGGKFAESDIRNSRTSAEIRMRCVLLACADEVIEQWCFLLRRITTRLALRDNSM